MRAAVPVSKLTGGSRETLPWILSCTVVLLSLAYLFTDGLVFIAKWWGHEEYSHGWLIPPVALFVIWQRRRAIEASWGQGSWLGLVIVLLAMGLLLLGEAAQFQRIPSLAFVLALMGLGLAVLGWSAMRYLWVPLAFLLFAMPLPGSLYVPLSMKLQLISSELGAFFLELAGISVFLDGNVIDLGIYKLQVAEACSGLRYLFPLSAFGFLCAWLYRAPFWAKSIVFLATAPITVLMNSLRIAMTGLFIEFGSVELAEGFMHLFEGWVIFLAALGVLFALMWLLARLAGSRAGFIDLLDFDRMAGAHIAAGRPSARPTGLPMPWLAAMALLVLTVPADAALKGREQILPLRPGLITFPLSFAGDGGELWYGRPQPLEEDALQAVGADDHLLADFEEGEGRGVVNLWVAYYDEQIRDAAIHSPKDCLPGGGWEYVTFEEVDAPVRNIDGRTFKLNRGVITKGQQEMLLYYWLEMRGRKLTNDFTLKFYNLWDSLTMRRSDGALVRLITPLSAGETPADGDARLAAFLAGAYPLLEPHLGR